MNAPQALTLTGLASPSADLWRGRRAAALLNELSCAHEAVREAIELKLEIAGATTAAPTHCSLARWKLSRARHARRKVLASIAAEIAADASPFEAALLRRLHEDELKLSQACADHLQRWTAEAIAANWAGYAQAATDFCARLRKRVAAEAEGLYPVLAARAERQI